ncbi:MAG: HEAT repeat domain-containing protein [Deltaproteobacteria bacterium]|nr:MAG: HEAT repeat domain-containing protein [Deltaproteobacteria bacterium]
MKKKSYADLGCLDRVKTMQQEQSTPVQAYQRKARSVVARMRMANRSSASLSALPAVDSPRPRSRPQAAELLPSVVSQPANIPAVSPQQLQALVYQARYSTNASLRQEALRGLCMASRFSESTIEALEAALNDEVAEVRETAAKELASFPPPLSDTLLDQLIARVWDPDISVRKAVAASLAHHPDPRSIGPLMGLLGTPDDELRYIVHQSLVKITEQLGPPPPRSGAEA